MDEQVNPLERDHSLSVVLPGGLEKNATVHGSKPVMDLLVTLCASYHLNPSDYTVEVLSLNKNNISFKPNSPIGSLEAEKIVLKPRGMEEKIRRPYMPEASVRLLINYNKSHKAVVRVNPRVPLEMLLPVVCDKCEFQVETTVLLRDSQCQEPLDLNKTLNEHGLREVFARDTAGHQHKPTTPEATVMPTAVIPPPPLQDLPKKEKKPKDNPGFLSLFRRKKRAEMEGARSAPASPGCNKPVGVSMNVQGVSTSTTLPTDMPQKRRAPQPPMGASQSVPNNLATCHVGGSQRSAESTLRSTKRRAPPPPCANSQQELQAHAEVKGTVDSLNAVEELSETDESHSVNLSLPSSSSLHLSHPRSSSSSSRPSFAHLHKVADPYLPSFRGKDLSDARCALAKVLTSSISKGTLTKHLRNSATFPKSYSGSSFMSMTQRCSDNGAFCAEHESVLTSNLPTEHEWEDPAQKKGMTTFKVVPLNKQQSHNAALTPDQRTVEDNPESEASPEFGRNLTETEEDPCSPDTSETEAPLQSPETSSGDTSETETPLQSPEPFSEDRSETETPLQSPEPSSKDRSETETPLQSPEHSSEDRSETEAPLQSPEHSSEDRSETEAPLQSPDSSSKDRSETETPLQSPDSSSKDRSETETPLQSPEPFSEDRSETETPLQSPEPSSKDRSETETHLQSPEPSSKDRSETETPLHSPEPSSEEIEASDRPASLPPPHDPDCRDSPVSPLSDVGDTVQKQTEKEEPEVPCEASLAAPSDCSDGELSRDHPTNSADQTECQSPSGQSVSTDVDRCASYTDEKEVEEEAVQEEEEEEDFFPPPPPPVFFEDMEAIEEKREDATASSLPSRFAQAVAMAVQRSRLQSHDKGLGPPAPSGPHSTLPSSPRSTYQYGA
ncbi:cordon-bleu protein-like 1 [Perca flavescens]|uniref:cordon-bleu protein-like 1 n=1 Tax=Perca flavescens TaxID=8167 RepID=UPI00106E86B1|nr:cordon-bleu protein-like 1 [Perca flavescens]XP_028427859.1 cordon-bleu protein-like 1 [Perca flavescens]XP_028427860.1 cordon-bleu protein-like 1 [Perca flavescens]